MTDDYKPFTGRITDCRMYSRFLDLSDPDILRKIMNDEIDDITTRKVTPAELEENFALRDEIKQLRILIAAIIRDQGGRMLVSEVSLQSIRSGDTFTKEAAAESHHIVLTFEGKP